MRSIFIIFCCSLAFSSSAQSLPDSCKLAIGTNLGGISDYGTEMPFVDVMHNCRTWYTKDLGNPNGSPFNSGNASKLSYRSDGYPTQVPQTISGVPYPQKVVTIWAITSGWTAGTYTVLYDGTGTLSFWGGFSNLQQTSPNRLTFDFNNPSGNILEMTIESSDANDPIRNIRVLMPGAESTYETQPFNPVWLEKLLTFRSVRFMDWFSTNSWGQSEPWDWDYPERYEWSERQQLNQYPWTNGKGIPYEMAIKLLNDYDLDGWICVPHRASDDFIRQMAQLFHNTVEPERTLTVEYSNETWNWIFGQAQWLNKYGCVNTGTPWPEGTVPYIQNCLDIWTDVFLDAPERLVRVVGVQTGWQDVSNRTVFNMVPGSLDAFATTYYFGLNDEADAALDVLGANATAADIAFWARKSSITGERKWLLSQKNEISTPLNLPMVFYEGGQHLTPNPFGEEPTYAQALLDIQRDTAMYNLYNEQYNFIRTLQSGDKPLQLMNFSFISSRSARYGSWGLLETMDQDLDQIPAPKYQATLENMANCITVSTIQAAVKIEGIRVFPNPTCNAVQMSFAHDLVADVSLLNASGIFVAKQAVSGATTIRFEMKDLESGVYWVVVQTKDGVTQTYRVVKG